MYPAAILAGPDILFKSRGIHMLPEVPVQAGIKRTVTKGTIFQSLVAGEITASFV
jgi:hypothetical protein